MVAAFLKTIVAIERENISEQFACFIENLKVCNDCCFGVVKGLFLKYFFQVLETA